MLESFWYLYKGTDELFKPNASKQKFFHSICPYNRLNNMACVRKWMHIWILYPV